MYGENVENIPPETFKVPTVPNIQTPPSSVESSILKHSTKDNLIAFSPAPKHLKVHFLTPKQNSVRRYSPEKPASELSTIDSPDWYNFIREIDDQEKWCERTEVVTKRDHTENVVIAQSVIQEIIDNLPLRDSANKTGRLSDLSNDNCDTTMADDDEIIPPKASYNFNFDDIDSIDPFTSSKGLANSPPASSAAIIENPFQTKSKVSSSPPPDAGFHDDNINPFASRRQLPNSPPPPTMKGDITSEEMSNSNVENSSSSSLKGFQNVTDINDNENGNKNGAAAGMDTSCTGSDLSVKSDDSKASSTGSEKVVKKKSPPKKKGPPKRFLQANKNFLAANQANDDVIIFDPKSKRSSAAASDRMETSSTASVASDAASETGELPSCTAASTVAKEIVCDDFDALLRPTKDVQIASMTEFDTAGISVFSSTVMSQEGLGSFSEDEFKSATEVFSDPSAWDMLEKFGEGNSDNPDSALTRQSLYVKFDPLVQGDDKSPGNVGVLPNPRVQGLAKKTSNSQLASLAENPNASVYSEDLLLMNTPPPNKPLSRLKQLQMGQSRLAPQQPASDLDNILTCSPKLDEENQTDSGRPESETPSKHDSVEPSRAGTGIVEVLKYTESDFKKLKQQMEMDFQAQLLAKERSCYKKVQDLQQEIAKLTEENKALSESVDNMTKVVAEYEKTISQVIADKETVSASSAESMTELIQERNHLMESLQSMEKAFSDMLKRHDRSKEVVESQKKNEEQLKKCITDYQEKMKKAETKYQALKRHAEEKLVAASEEIEKVTKSKDNELTRLQLAVKKSEVQIKSLETAVAQKTKENEELTSICDDLISQVGGGGS
ncbi:uncharacterized protein LOC141898649 [Tubulanus polymorphus]|uniref:uncharacterized protein LOC141898649 n=1 Tax=Tubulanus polymorphus TaxID=672921 RepID=UPI003DA34D84